MFDCMKRWKEEIEEERRMFPQYLADGVWAEWDGHRVILSGDSGMSGKLALTPKVLFELDLYCDFVGRVAEEMEPQLA